MSQEPLDQRSLELAYAAYLRTHAASLLRFGLTMCATREDAEDNVAETFRKLWKVWPEKYEDIKDRGIAYAMTVLQNTIIDRARYRGRRFKEYELEAHHETLALSPVDVEHTYLFGEFQREIWAAVATLPEIHQKLIYLVYVEEYSVRSAAQQLGLSNTNAGRYHKYALAELKKLIEGHYEEHQIG